MDEPEPAGLRVPPDADGDIGALHPAREKLWAGVPDAGAGQAVVDPDGVPVVPVDGGEGGGEDGLAADAGGARGVAGVLLPRAAGAVLVAAPAGAEEFAGGGGAVLGAVLPAVCVLCA